MDKIIAFRIKHICGLICADADSLVEAAVDGDRGHFGIDEPGLILAARGLNSHLLEIADLMK